MDFSAALQELRNGRVLYRKGWNSTDQFIYLVPQGSYPPQTEVAKTINNGNDVAYGPYIAIKTVSGLVYPWLATQSDLLSDDWEMKN